MAGQKRSKSPEARVRKEKVSPQVEPEVVSPPPEPEKVVPSEPVFSHAGQDIYQALSRLDDTVKKLVDNYNAVASRINQHEEALKSIVDYLQGKSTSQENPVPSQQISPSTRAGGDGDATKLLQFANMVKNLFSPQSASPWDMFMQQILPDMMRQMLQDQIDMGKLMKAQLMRRVGVEISEMTFKD
jgi:hypothetical protein